MSDPHHRASKSLLPFLAVAVLLAALAPAGLAAQSVDILVAPPSAALQAGPSGPPLRIAERFGVEPLATLAEAAVAAREEIEAVMEWNAAGRRPMKDGFVRPLPLPRLVAFPESVTTSPASLHAGGALVRHARDTVVWGAEIRVEGAHRLRAHLDDVRLPEGVRLWVYGQGDEAAGPFGRELLGPDGLWTPSVAGPVLRIEAELPRRTAGDVPRFTVDRVAELLPLEGDGLPDGVGRPKGGVDASCLIDVTCVTEGDLSIIRLVERAIGHMHFVKGGSTFLCSGGLLNDVGGTFTPFFLTANHCLSSQASASSLEVFWDFFTDTCFGPFPTHNSRPRSNGSTLLATGKSADFTFLRLLNVPANRVFLGWNANASAFALNTLLHRVSHPAPNGSHFPLSYSNQRVKKPSPSPCAGGAGQPPVHDQTKFFYSTKLDGGTFGGSSGSPVFNASGETVGQLLGSCGPPELAGEGCHPTPFILDGAFAETFKFISSFLQGGGGGGGCVPGEFTVCAVDGRFEITATAGRSLFPGLAGRVSPAFLGDFGGAFHFFKDEDNFHVVIKILKRPSGFYAVSVAGLDLFAMTVRVRDTETGEVRTYSKLEGELSLPVDSKAFPANP